MPGHTIGFYLDPDTQPSGWRAVAVNGDDVEIAEARGSDVLTAACALAAQLADENEERGKYVPDDYVDLAQRDVVAALRELREQLQPPTPRCRWCGVALHVVAPIGGIGLWRDPEGSARCPAKTLPHDAGHEPVRQPAEPALPVNPQ